jgi:hypothetical protein
MDVVSPKTKNDKDERILTLPSYHEDEVLTREHSCDEEEGDPFQNVRFSLTQLDDDSAQGFD